MKTKLVELFMGHILKAFRAKKIGPGWQGGSETNFWVGEVEEVLVHRPEVLVLPEVDVAQALEVERCPGDKEEDNH